MSDSRKKLLEDSGIYEVVKKSFERADKVHDEYFLLLIADYLYSLESIRGALGADTAKALSELVYRMDKIAFVDPLVSKTKITNNTAYIAYHADSDETKYEFFSVCSEVVAKTNDTTKEKSGFKDASNDYLTQLVYGVSKNPAMADQINSVTGKNEISSYANIYSKNLSLANFLNMIAVSSGLSINYVISLTLEEGGIETLKSEYDKIHGEGKFDQINEILNKFVELQKDSASNSNNSKLTAEGLLNSKNNDVDSNLGEYDGVLKDQIEVLLLRDFLANNNDEYIVENAERIKECLSNEEMRIHFDKKLEEKRQNIKVRKLDKKTATPSGFISLKYIFIIISLIIITSFLAYLFLIK